MTTHSMSTVCPEIGIENATDYGCSWWTRVWQMLAAADAASGVGWQQRVAAGGYDSSGGRRRGDATITAHRGGMSEITRAWGTTLRTTHAVQFGHMVDGLSAACSSDRCTPNLPRL